MNHRTILFIFAAAFVFGSLGVSLTIRNQQEISNKGSDASHLRIITLAGHGMIPNYEPDKKYTIDETYYQSHKPARGDVILYTYEQNGIQTEFVKRIVGLPGERIKISDGYVYINGTVLNEIYVSEKGNLPTWENSFIGQDEVLIIPENEYFVLGDNRPNTVDSRDQGFIPFSNIKGKLID